MGDQVGSKAGGAVAVTIALAATMLACSAVSLVEGFTPAPAADGAGRETAAALEVIVEPDARPFKGRSRIGTGFVALIPLVPYGHQQISPEFGVFATSLKNSGFPADLGDVVIKDLRAARLARWVGTPDDRLSSEPAYALHLTVEQGIYHRNVTLYGLTLAGAFLWMVGFPVSYGSAEIAVTADLRDPAGQPLGTRRFTGRARGTEWFYYPATRAYTSKMPAAYRQISPQLRDFVAEGLAGASKG